MLLHTLRNSFLFSHQFCLPKVEKEQYEKEEHPDTQQEILKKVVVGLPVFTRTGTGGENLTATQLSMSTSNMVAN